jgi:hypothetical protein
MCFISFIVTCSLVGYPVAVTSTASNKCKWQSCRRELTMKEVNGPELHITSATERKTVKNENCANNTEYYEWLCVRMTQRICSS